MSFVLFNPFELTYVAMARHLSPFTRASAVLNPRLLAPIVGPEHGGFEFLKGNFSGIEGYAVGRDTSPTHL